MTSRVRCPNLTRRIAATTALLLAIAPDTVNVSSQPSPNSLFFPLVQHAHKHLAEPIGHVGGPFIDADVSGDVLAALVGDRIRVLRVDSASTQYQSDLLGDFRALNVHGGRLYASTPEDLIAFSLEDPREPRELWRRRVGEPTHLLFADHRQLVARGERWLAIWALEGSAGAQEVWRGPAWDHDLRVDESLVFDGRRFALSETAFASGGISTRFKQALHVLDTSDLSAIRYQRFEPNLPFSTMAIDEGKLIVRIGDEMQNCASQRISSIPLDEPEFDDMLSRSYVIADYLIEELHDLDGQAWIAELLHRCPQQETKRQLALLSRSLRESPSQAKTSRFPVDTLFRSQGADGFVAIQPKVGDTWLHLIKADVADLRMLESERQPIDLDHDADAHSIMHGLAFHGDMLVTLGTRGLVSHQLRVTGGDIGGGSAHHQALNGTDLAQLGRSMMVAEPTRGRLSVFDMEDDGSFRPLPVIPSDWTQGFQLAEGDVTVALVPSPPGNCYDLPIRLISKTPAEPPAVAGSIARRGCQAVIEGKRLYLLQIREPDEPNYAVEIFDIADPATPRSIGDPLPVADLYDMEPDSRRVEMFIVREEVWILDSASPEGQPTLSRWHPDGPSRPLKTMRLWAAGEPPALVRCSGATGAHLFTAKTPSVWRSANWWGTLDPASAAGLRASQWIRADGAIHACAATNDALFVQTRDGVSVFARP